MSIPLYIPESLGSTQLYLGGDPELFNQLETAPWRSVEYLRQILSLFGNEPLAEDSEAQSLIRLFKIDTAKLQEQWNELNQEAFDDPFGNERYVLAPEYKLLPPREEITIPEDVDLNKVPTADEYYLLARALADTIIDVIFSKADFYFFKPSLDGITNEDDDYETARNLIFFLLESQYFSENLCSNNFNNTIFTTSH
ncbi:MAG TPA: hypothetical protein PK957_04145 [Candidatus Dojkabacteria bacterium]|nr:hypothetical protein [Candidatus Dojkabacteria bacterium]HQF36337.1 hypothetical protein [Candidatus Dojkabacteria bacterium]